MRSDGEFSTLKKKEKNPKRRIHVRIVEKETGTLSSLACVKRINKTIDETLYLLFGIFRHNLRKAYPNVLVLRSIK